jgi:gamma-butyrobetaine dioxygenase
MLRFPAVWLRDSCPCAECLDPGSGQKLKDITELPAGLAVSAAEDTEESVVVTYAPDGHRSTFARSWLAAHALGPAENGGGRTEDDKELWPPADLAGNAGGLPEASWPRYLAEPADRARALDAVLRWGFVLLRDVPAEPGMVLQVAASFGFVRETNYGRLFDVRVDPRRGVTPTWTGWPAPWPCWPGGTTPQTPARACDERRSRDRGRDDRRAVRRPGGA